MLDWLKDHEALLWVLGILSVIMFVGSLIAIPVLVVSMPADYFRKKKPPPGSWRGRHPALSALILVLKNVIGAVLILSGIAMLVLPGQGILSILIGISLTNFPGKRRLELAIVQVPAVHRAIDWMRRRRGRPPLEVPPRSAG